MSDLTLLGLCGSLRAQSTNRLLMREAAHRFGDAQFVEGDIRFPLFDDDIQQGEGLPDAVVRLAEQIKTADAIIVVTPEYNKGLSGSLKNALDWVSRVPGGVWADKPVAIMSAAAGRAGGERAQNMLRLCLNPFQPRLISGPEVMVGATADQWDADGRLANERNVATLEKLMAKLRREAEMAKGAAA